jgi:hypothetical protein
LRANGSRERAPMTGSAKQSSFGKTKLDCFVAYALRNDVEISRLTIINDGEPISNRPKNALRHIRTFKEN